jgi:hypothetical protein
MRTIIRISTTMAAALVLVIGTGAESHAQCLISGPTQVCPGASVTLCAPTRDNAMYWWQGPDGSAYLSQCITVSALGPYTLTVSDWSTNTQDTCSVVLTSGLAAAPAITGAASTCNGTTTSWCGPTGNFAYAWSGPNGFSASTACVDLGVAGDYALRIRPLPDGCWGDSTVQSLALTVCNTPPPAQNCPRIAAWWANETSSQPGGERLRADLTGQVAACVDQNDPYFDWSSPVDGLRQTLGAPHRTLRMSAMRQVAAVRANTCAGPIGVQAGNGSAVSLDPATPITLPGTSGTIADWLAAADADLATLSRMKEHSAAANAGYRRLIVAGWHINHGLGIGATCAPAVAPDASSPSRAATPATVILPNDAEPLAGELIDESSGTLEFGELSPNPFTTSTSLAFAVESSAASDVVIGVYDVSGRLVRELVRGTFAPGRYVTAWDGRSADGMAAHSGTYFILGRVGSERTQTRVALVH